MRRGERGLVVTRLAPTRGHSTEVRSKGSNPTPPSRRCPTPHRLSILFLQGSSACCDYGIQRSSLRSLPQRHYHSYCAIDWATSSARTRLPSWGVDTETDSAVKAYHDWIGPFMKSITLTACGSTLSGISARISGNHSRAMPGYPVSEVTPQWNPRGKSSRPHTTPYRLPRRIFYPSPCS